MPASSAIVLISVGNTRTRFALVSGEGKDARLEPSEVQANGDVEGLAQTVAATAGRTGASEGGESGDGDGGPGEATAIIASTNHPVAEQLEAALLRRNLRAARFGRDLEIPILHALDEDGSRTVGQDRLLDALGAFARSQQACIVIDAGTAVTVDFVDGQGTFHGGAIAPGVRMMLRALHEQTASLPLVALSRDMLPGESSPSDDNGDSLPPFGRNTAQAIALGVASAIRGLAHHLIDRYAEFYKAYPRVVATGGDAPILFEGDPLVETIVPDLTLVGMLEAVKRLESIDDRIAE